MLEIVKRRETEDLGKLKELRALVADLLRYYHRRRAEMGLPPDPAFSFPTALEQRACATWEEPCCKL